MPNIGYHRRITADVEIQAYPGDLAMNESLVIRFCSVSVKFHDFHIGKSVPKVMLAVRWWSRLNLSQIIRLTTTSFCVYYADIPAMSLSRTVMKYCRLDFAAGPIMANA